MLQAIIASISTLLVTGSWATIDESFFDNSRIITRDVAIIGGGASGTFSAVRLREDLNASIILIEKKTRLGGHVDTYTVPHTNSTIEYGVQSYIRYGGAVDFFKRFNIDIVPSSARRLTNINVDITTGKALIGYTPPTANATTEALQRWLTIVEKYEPFMEPGFWNFPPGSKIPADLLTPFGEFARKHQLEAAAPRIIAVSNVGLGGIEDLLTLYVIKAFGAPITRSLFADAPNALFVPVGSNSLLYQRAYELLKTDVLLSSSVAKAERTTNGARLVVQTPDGKVLVNAKCILFSPPPSLDPNLKNFDLDTAEKAVFRTWVPTWSFIGIVRIPCIPENYSISYISPASVPDNYLAVRNYRYSLRFDSTGPLGLGLFRVLFSTNFSITADEVKTTISENVQKLVAQGTVNYTGECVPDYRVVTDHNSILWQQTVKQLRDGFVQKLYALQGHRSTWYTGGLWSEDYTSNTWAFSETIIPRLLEDLRKVD